jgi:hypothetical protein
LTLTESFNPCRRIRHQTKTAKLHQTQNPFPHSQQATASMDIRATFQPRHQRRNTRSKRTNCLPHKKPANPQTRTKHKILNRPTQNTSRNRWTNKKRRKTHWTYRTLPSPKRRHIRRTKLHRTPSGTPKKQSHSHHSPLQS